MVHYIPAIFCTGLILWLSVTSGTNFPESFKDLFSYDKLGHAFAYGILSASYFYAIRQSKRVLTIKKMIYVCLGTILYGILLEFVQYLFFPGRYFEVLDILANIMGIVISFLIFKQLIIFKTTAP